MYKRVLTMQDISCLGQCSMTVALPILSACGLETCVLPTAILSTHTGGFGEVSFRDLSAEVEQILHQWDRLEIDFDAIYTGYLGTERHVELALRVLKTQKAKDAVAVVDPAMADHGKLYRGLDAAYALKMRELCAHADVLLPNVTEACMLADVPYCPELSEAEVDRLLEKLSAKGTECIVLTGAPSRQDQCGIAVWDHGKIFRYAHERIDRNYHGTGDIFAAAFTGALMQGKSVPDAVKLAADFTLLCAKNTAQAPVHWYGIQFETALPALIRMLELE